MKRNDLNRIVKSFGMTVEDGRKHLHIRDKDGRLVAVYPRGKWSDAKHARANLLACLKRAAAIPPA